MSWANRAVRFRQGYWPLNGHADDVSGYGNDGTLVNAPTWADAPWGRQCIEFNGVTQHIVLGDLAYLNAVSAFTLAFWMNQDVLDADDVIFRKALDASNSLYLWTRAGGRMQFEMGDIDIHYDYSTVIFASSWHHVAYVFDGSQTGDANRIIVYVDGVPVALTFVGSVPAVTSDLTGYDATLGYSASTFDGKLSEFQIFSVPLARDEIVDLMKGHG